MGRRKRRGRRIINIDMKNLKRINEDWSDDYVYDFKDNGFDVEENGLVLKGQYKGKFLITQVSSWFEEMLGQMGEEHKVLRTKTYFNELTGNANFEVEIKQQIIAGDSIEVSVGREKVKYFPKEVIALYVSRLVNLHQIQRHNSEIYLGHLIIEGALESGQKKSLKLGRYRNRVNQTTENEFALGSRGRGISVDKENIEKIFDMIENNRLPIKYFDENGNWKIFYSDIPEERRPNFYFSKQEFTKLKDALLKGVQKIEEDKPE